MGTVHRFVALLWRASIWHPTAVPHDAAYRYVSPLKRVFLPAYDVIIVWLGLAGLVLPFQSVATALPAPGPAVLYLALAAAGVGAGIGVVFPQLWRCEVVSKIMILALLAMVTITMVVAGLTLPHHTGVTATPLLVGLTIPPLIRLWTLGSELGDRRATRATRGGAG